MAQEMLTRNSCEFCGREHDLAKRENCLELLEGAAISVARKIISRVYVLDMRQSPRLARILCIVSKMSFQTKFLEWKECNVG